MTLKSPFNLGLLVVVSPPPEFYPFNLGLLEVVSPPPEFYPFNLGLLEVVSPPPEFYPEMSSLKQTLGDEMERVVWRSKQVPLISHSCIYLCIHPSPN